MIPHIGYYLIILVCSAHINAAACGPRNVEEAIAVPVNGLSECIKDEQKVQLEMLNLKEDKHHFKMVCSGPWI